MSCKIRQQHRGRSEATIRFSSVAAESSCLLVSFLMMDTVTREQPEELSPLRKRSSSAEESAKSPNVAQGPADERSTFGPALTRSNGEATQNDVHGVRTCAGCHRSSSVGRSPSHHLSRKYLKKRSTANASECWINVPPPPRSRSVIPRGRVGFLITNDLWVL